MQFPSGRGTVLWGVGVFVSLLFLSLISNHYNKPAPIEDTYKNIAEKKETLSQMRINLLKSVEMEKNAVMAITDEESREFADQSLMASATVDQDLKRLGALIEKVPLQDEQHLAVEFNNCWTELRKLDQVILELAVQNTNLKAASLSREKGAEAMRRFEHALGDMEQSTRGTPNEGRVARLSCRAMTAGLKLYNLHSPHIAEASDTKMDEIETQMKAEQNEAAAAFDELTKITGIESRESVSQAKAVFAEFMDVTAKVIKLSRQNSNVKSLELSLGRKRKVTTQCDEILAAFQEVVQKRTFKATR